MLRFVQIFCRGDVKANLILLFSSTVISLLLSFALWRGYQYYWATENVGIPEGGKFKSLAHFRETVTKRDERDKQADGSVSLRSIINPHPSDEIIYRLKPNLDVKFKNVRVITNSHGMRSPEVSVEKADCHYRIALLGDSYAFGWGVKQDKIFARVLEEKLNETNQQDLTFEVLNFAVPGYSTFQEVAALREYDLKFDLDAVLVFFVENDFGMPFYIHDLQDRSKLYQEFRLRKKIRKIKDPEKKAELNAFMDRLNPNRALAELAAITKERDMPLFLAINPKKNWTKERDKLWILHQEPYIRLLQIRDSYIGHIRENNIPVQDLKLSKSDPHPSELRHGIFGNSIAMAMSEELAGKLPQCESVVNSSS